MEHRVAGVPSNTYHLPSPEIWIHILLLMSTLISGQENAGPGKWKRTTSFQLIDYDIHQNGMLWERNSRLTSGWILPLIVNSADCCLVIPVVLICYRVTLMKLINLELKRRIYFGIWLMSSVMMIKHPARQTQCMEAQAKHSNLNQRSSTITAWWQHPSSQPMWKRSLRQWRAKMVRPFCSAQNLCNIS